MPESPWNTIPIETGREEDGRYWADVPALPGVMAYGASPEAAVQAAQSLALRVAADLIDAGEPLPEPFEHLFAVA